jgi:formate C-acetyltransferase/4-hydroxyphenylacetate decarboxylase large subunit
MISMQKVVEREVRGNPSTERVKKRLEALWNSDLRLDTERAKLYTEYVKEHWNEPVYTRQGGALKYILSNLTPVIYEDELIVGRISRFVRGTQLYPEQEVKWIDEALSRVEREEERYAEGTRAKAVSTTKGGLVKIGLFGLDPKELPILREVLDFWRGRDCRSLAEGILREREDYAQVELWQKQLLFLPFMFDVPEGRVIVDYGRVIDEGLESIINRCREKIRRLGSIDTAEKLNKYDFYNGVILALEGVVAFAERYAEEAERLAEKADDERRREELLEIARICRKVPRYRADTFREAVQSFWFTHCALFIEMNGRGISPGRFDQYMYRPFTEDIKAGRITEAEVLELLELLRVKHSEIVRAHAVFTESYLGGSIFQNLTLGGVDRYGLPADNELSILILQAGINAQTIQPTLSIRWNDKLSHAFKKKAAECIKAGAGYPAIFNDRLGIERFLRVTGANLEDARDWAPCGCVDMQICGKRMPMYAVPNTNFAKLLELILFDGVNPVTGDKLIETKLNAEEATYEELVEEFKRCMHLVLEKEAQYWNTVMLVHNKIGIVHPLCSALLDDCLERGVDCLQGGCRYNDAPYLISCGLVNVANSLAAIKKCIFEEKLFTMKELKEALRRDFEGYESIWRHLLKAPKFGNDDDYVDSIAVELYDAYSDAVQRNLNWLGQPWRPSTLSVTSQVVLGQATGATPDGRRAFKPLCDGATSAYPGTDINGPTALVHSAVKIHAWNLQSTLMNMKFNPLAIEGDPGTEKLIAFIDTFVELGGYHIQFNVIDSAMLRDAQKHPEKYPDLLVRVAGFTARFIDLGPSEQEEIIKRTEYLGL